MDILCSNLEIAGIRTKPFTDSTVALEEAIQNPPDLILTDLNMPKLSGMELIQKLRRVNPDIPVIVVSGYVTVDGLLRGISSGVFAVVQKPINEQALISYALAAIRNHKLYKMIRRSLNLLVYQFADLEDFLKTHDKDDIAKATRTELTALLAQWKEATRTSVPPT